MATRSDVAQASSSNSTQTPTPSTSGQAPAPRVITLAKPAGDQAVIVHLDGPAVLNLANIANENITLVRVGGVDAKVARQPDLAVRRARNAVGRANEQRTRKVIADRHISYPLIRQPDGLPGERLFEVGHQVR